MTTVYGGEFKCSQNNLRSQATAEFLEFVAAYSLAATGSEQQTYNANYWPGMHTTALWLVHVRCKGKSYLFFVGLLPCKRGGG